MKILTLVLSPIMWVMRLVLVALHTVTGSYGFSIVLLSIAVRTATAPLSAIARRSEGRDNRIQAAMQPALAEIKRTSTGRERFERTEELYNKHGYHPIHSVGSLLPLFLQLPFLLAALFLLSEFPPLAGERFLVISDLLRPDGLISLGGLSVNVLPILIVAVTLIESAVKVSATRSSRLRFLVVAAVIAVLIYPAPSGVCLYWLTSTVYSLALALVQRFREPIEAAA